jgi:hypothetical protein
MFKQSKMCESANRYTHKITHTLLSILTFAALSTGFLFSVPTPALAEITVSAQHELISIAETADGIDFDLFLTLQNSGTESLSDVTLMLLETTFWTRDGVFSVGYLPEGGTVTRSFIISSASPEQIPGVVLPLLCKGTDDSGALVEFTISSEEVGQ